MSEKRLLQITLEMDDRDIEKLKSCCRSEGFTGLSATQVIVKALELFRRDAFAVKLLEPERREIETRSGTGSPIRTSKDIQRAFERMSGSATSVLVDIDPGIAGMIRDQSMQQGFTYSEMLTTIIHEAWNTQFMETVEMYGVYFNSHEWKHLLKSTGRERIRSGQELVELVDELQRAVKPVVTA